MIKKPPIRFGCMISSNSSRPGLISWLIVTAILCVGLYLGFLLIPLVGFLVIGLGFLVFLPAVVGALAGWFLGGVRNECKQFFSHRRLSRSFRHKFRIGHPNY